MKQNSSLRFIQSDFFRYFLVLSDQLIEQNQSNNEEYAKTCQNLKSEFPNSFVLYFNENFIKQNSNCKSNESSTVDKDSTQDDMTQLNIDMNCLSFKADNSTESVDPLSAAIESSENSKFYNDLVSQRQQNSQCSNANTSQSIVNINEWYSTFSLQEQMKVTEDLVADTVNLMLRYFFLIVPIGSYYFFFREFISKSLIPWAERQIKILGELIAQRKGFRKSIFSATRSIFSNMSSSTASLTKSLTGTSLSGNAPSGVIYIPDAQEMQQRKLADICMIFGMYEMAHSLYYSARKDFQSESAWLYYAGASEMSAISSYFLNKYQHNHIDQAIMAYMDTCKNVNLATRASILATELLCQLKRFHDAATLYIRMTGDDSDFRSALFLEQASKCFLTVSPQISMKLSTSQALLSAMLSFSSNETVGTFGARYRKAAFHYIIAGHRYNRCGLKHFALSCYRRFNYPNWEFASDHINMTVAKLFIAIGSSNNRKYIDYNQKGLEIYRSCSHKKSFFNEFFYELKKLYSTDSVQFQDLYKLKIPFIEKFLFVTLDSIQLNETYAFISKPQPHTCMVGEEIRILLTLTSPLEIILSNFQLICDKPQQVFISVESNQIVFQPNDPVDVLLRFSPIVETEFSLFGFEYSIENFRFQKLFSQKMQNSMKFKSITSLPLIPLEITIPELGFTLSTHTDANPSQPFDSVIIPTSVCETEIITINISCASAIDPTMISWIQLFTNVKSFYQCSNDDVDCESKLACYNLYISNPGLSLQLQIPQNQAKYMALFKLVYVDQDNRKNRVVLRRLHFDVIPCVNIDLKIDSIITLRNLLSFNLTILDVDIGDNGLNETQTGVTIPSNHSAHLLLLSKHFRWTIFTGGTVPIRNGRLVLS